MIVSAATILAALSTGEQLFSDGVALYQQYKTAMSAKDQAAIEAAIAKISSICDTDFSRVDGELAAAERDEAQPAPQPAPASPAPGT